MTTPLTAALCDMFLSSRPSYLLCGMGVTTLGTGAGGGHDRGTGLKSGGLSTHKSVFFIGHQNEIRIKKCPAPYTIESKGKGFALRSVPKRPIVHVCRAGRHAVCVCGVLHPRSPLQKVGIAGSSGGVRFYITHLGPIELQQHGV